MEFLAVVGDRWYTFAQVMKVKPQVSKSISPMGRLLASHKDSFIVLHKGDMVRGKITKLMLSEILVDIGAKTAAVVLEKERSLLHTYLSVFKTGDDVDVLVLTPESELGQPIVSLRRQLGDISWRRLEKYAQNHEPLDVKVTDIAKAGYVVATGFGISGFLPQSHISFSGGRSVSVGDSLSVTVHELNRKDNKIIFSQKPVFSDEEFTKLTAKFKPNEKIAVTITNITSFGLFVSMPASGSGIPLEGFIHISEISWERAVELQNLFTTGAKIDAVIIKVDKDSKKVQLSIKRLTGDPFEGIMEKYPVEKQVKGTIDKIGDGGISLSLEDGTPAYIKAEKAPPTVSYKPGQEISVLVSEYDKRRKRIFVVPVLLKKQIGYR